MNNSLEHATEHPLEHATESPLLCCFLLLLLLIISIIIMMIIIVSISSVVPGLVRVPGPAGGPYSYAIVLHYSIVIRVVQ